MAMDGTLSLEWEDGFYEADDVTLGYKADF